MKRVAIYRLIYLFCVLITMVLGLLSRADFMHPPQFVVLYVGDFLWAMMVYWCVCVLKPEWSSKTQFIVATSFCFAIELSQLYQGEWLNAIRQTTLGGLILGFGFKASDLIAYVLGTSGGSLLNTILIRRIGVKQRD